MIDGSFSFLAVISFLSNLGALVIAAYFSDLTVAIWKVNLRVLPYLLLLIGFGSATVAGFRDVELVTALFGFFVVVFQVVHYLTGRR
jgi:hypothetical protein